VVDGGAGLKAFVSNAPVPCSFFRRTGHQRDGSNI